MSKFNVNDEVWLKGKVIRINNEKYNHEIQFDDGDVMWFDEKTLHTTNVKSKWFEVETVDAKESSLIKFDDVLDLIIDAFEKKDCNGSKYYENKYYLATKNRRIEITKESYNKLKERLMEE